MEHTELQHMVTFLADAHSPEDVFGSLEGTPEEMCDAGRRIYRQMAKILHPDLYQGTVDFERASFTFKTLLRFWGQAQVKIESNTYGPPDATDATTTFQPFVLHTPERLYNVERLLAQGDLAALYVGNVIAAADSDPTQVIIKIPLQPLNNDLVANEARILRYLRVCDNYDQLCHFISQLTDTFAYQEEVSGILRQVDVLAYTEGFYSLEEVQVAYPEGIDPKDMAWIWRRLLVALGFAHDNKVIHGSVLPSHILLHPDQHGLVLIDWSYAVLDPALTDERIRAISSAYRAWYPAEVFAKACPTAQLDIAMAAMCMFALLGGDPLKRTLPAHVPWQLQSHLQGCMHPHTQDVRMLLTEFDMLIERLWGPRTFHRFVMPKR